MYVNQKEIFSHVLENSMLQGWNGNENRYNLLCSKFMYIFFSTSLKLSENL